MAEALTISNAPIEHPAMDYAFLRQQGIYHLEQMAGHLWTDFNTHDPGITILEQLCYAITDLANRINYPIPDLMVEAGKAALESLPAAPDILSQNPVTLTDYRKILIDIEGVKNAWIDKIQSAAGEPALYYQPSDRALRLQSNPLAVVEERVAFKGLYRVQIEPEVPDSSTLLTAEVAPRLHALRGLCEDFAQIEGLEFEDITVSAKVETYAVDNTNELLREIHQRLADYISSPPRFFTLRQLLDAGKRIDEIFEGPLLKQGFIDSEQLRQAQRRTVLRTSDMIREIMDVPDVKAVRSIVISNGSTNQPQWSLTLDPARTPRLVTATSAITLFRNKLSIGGEPALRTVPEAPAPPSPASNGLPDYRQELPPISGRDRQVGRYYSVQNHFPATYGIGAGGLPENADQTRKAQANQLKAYLMFFDQLLANYFKQLSAGMAFFSFSGHSTRTYFSQVIDEQDLQLENILDLKQYTDEDGKWLQEISEVLPAGATTNLDYSRTNRFLDHLLARFAEQFTDYALVLYGYYDDAEPPQPRSDADDKLVKDKQAFLQNYLQIGGARGTAYNYRTPETEPLSGLERRLRHKLGITSPIRPTTLAEIEAIGVTSETFYLIEHILLRPVSEDLTEDVPEDAPQQMPILAGVARDPYSLQLTFVFPASPPRFQNSGFREFVNQSVREETPAHLTVTILWLDDRAIKDFDAAYTEWVERRLSYWEKKEKNAVVRVPPAIHIPLRAARDRVIDLLAIGQSYPLQDLSASVTQSFVPTGTSAQIQIENSQLHVAYQLVAYPRLETTPQEFVSEAVGTGAKLTIESPPITGDLDFEIDAQKMPWYLFELDAASVRTLLFNPETGKLLEALPAVFQQRLKNERRILFTVVDSKPEQSAQLSQVTANAIPGDLQRLLRRLMQATNPPQSFPFDPATGQGLESFEALLIQEAGNGQHIYLVKNQAGLFQLYYFPGASSYSSEASSHLPNAISTLHKRLHAQIGIDPGLTAWIADADHLDPSITTTNDREPRLVYAGERAKVTVTIDNVQVGVKYRLVTIDAQDVTVELSEQKTANANQTTMDLTSKELTQDTEIRIEATIDATSEEESQTGLLNAILPVMVRAKTDIKVRANTSTVAGNQFSILIDHNSSTPITIENPEPGTSYQLFTRPLPDLDILFDTPITPGSYIPLIVDDVQLNEVKVKKPAGGGLPWNPAEHVGDVGRGQNTLAETSDPLPPLPTGNLTEDSIVIIKASRQHGNHPIRSEVQLEQALLVLVRPNPAVTLSLQSIPATETEGEQFQVSHGDQGIFYHFYATQTPPDEDDGLVLPAYFHKTDATNPPLNKGVWQMRIFVDFVVARRMPPNVDMTRFLPDPQVDAAPLRAQGQLFVRAVKAQTLAAVWLGDQPEVPS